MTTPELKDFMDKVLKIQTICGWTAGIIEVEEAESGLDEIYVYCDIHTDKIDEATLYSSLHAVITDAEDLFGHRCLDSEILETGNKTIPYRLQLRLSYSAENGGVGKK